MKKDTDKRIEAEIVAERVKLLFAFCADLIPHKEMLKEVYEQAAGRSSLALTMAPILGAHGMNYEDAHFEAELHRKRAKALYKLIDTLEATENERVEFRGKQAEREKGRAEIARILGM